MCFRFKVNCLQLEKLFFSRKAFLIIQPRISNKIKPKSECCYIHTWIGHYFSMYEIGQHFMKKINYVYSVCSYL